MFSRSKTSIIPYEIVWETSDRSQKLEEIYHRGQDKIWNGRDVLEDLLKKHGEIDLDRTVAASLQRVFSLILWGEYAAWTISSQLAASLEDMGAKMAATSQAHDEARHFYVMRDYLRLLGPLPTALPEPSERVLSQVLSTDSLPKKLLGMQLMVEPVAMTLFQLIREKKTEPVLCDLLELIRRDEARHISLGVLHLPSVIEKLRRDQIAALWLWQAQLIMREMDALTDMGPDLRILGIDPDEALQAGIKRQMDALEETLQGLETSLPISAAMRSLISIRRRLDQSR
jgi:hypothetical protein